MFVTLATNTYLSSKYDYSNNKFNFSIKKDRLNEEDTYFTVFSEGQDDAMEYVLNNPELKILYKAPPALNGNSGYGTKPRNTLVIFELKDE